MTIIRQHIQTATAIAVAWSISEGDSIDITRLHLVLASAPTTAGNITLTVVSAAGSAYNTVIQSINPVGKTDISISDICGLSNGDSLLVSYANADTISIVGVANVELTQSFGRKVSVGEVQLDGVQEQTQIAGYDPSSGTTNFSEADPVPQHYDEELFTLTNVPNATPDETILIDMKGYQSCSVHVEKTGASADTFVWTMESNGESALSTDDWIDTTQFGWTSATITSAATYTADGILYSNRGFNPSGHKVKIETAGTGNDADFKVSVKKYY